VSRNVLGLKGHVRRTLEIVGNQPVIGIEMEDHAGRRRLESFGINVPHDRNDGMNIGRTFQFVSAGGQENSHAAPAGSLRKLGIE